MKQAVDDYPNWAAAFIVLAIVGSVFMAIGFLSKPMSVVQQLEILAPTYA